MQNAEPRPDLAIDRVILTVNDLETIRSFYEKAVGLGLRRADGESAELGTEDATLLELRRDKAARRASSREAGLFHTAFLLPSRAQLGAWLGHAGDTAIGLAGASDHLVSEAVYLSDPEGNGIEIYADRPRQEWTWRDGQVAMATQRLDVNGLLAAAPPGRWAGVPDGTSVGHVHLQVGSLPEAEAFYRDTLGFDITSRYPGGTFFARNGYHHHLAANIWNSRGAGLRDEPSTGLFAVVIAASPALIGEIRDRSAASIVDETEEGAVSVRDPWGTALRFERRDEGPGIEPGRSE